MNTRSTALLALTGLAALANPGFAQTSLTPMIPASFSEVAAKIAPSVVNISAVRIVRQSIPGMPEFEDPYQQEYFERFFGRPLVQNIPQKSLGSGVIVDPSGYIITNNHVIEKASEIVVRTKEGLEVAAEIVGSDPATDVAVLKLKGTRRWPAADLGNSDEVSVGDWVVAVGSPFTFEQTVTAGIISAKDRTIGQGPYDDFLQTDASINPGNSGGPLVDLSGRVIGINAAIISQSGGSLGIGFAVPINMARKVYQDILRTGRAQRGWLGVVVQPLDAELAKQFKLDKTEGALVTALAEGSPAERSGLKVGDVITAINGKPVVLPSELTRAVGQTAADSEAVLVVQREGRPVELKFRLGSQTAAEAKPMRYRRAQGKAQTAAAPLGLEVQDVTPELAQQLGTENLAGVVVTAVRPESAAENGGIRPGDILREVNRRPVRSKPEFLAAMQNLKAGDPLLLLLERDGTAIYLTMKNP